MKAIAFDKTAFRYYPGREDDGRDPPDVTDDHLARMAEIMDPWFESKHRGRGTQVFLFQRESKFWLVIRHGKPPVREGKHEEDGEAGVAFYQPQKHDVVIYDAVLDLLGINAESKGEKDLYRQTLGEVVFGDARYFGDGDVFSLAPIRNLGPDILNCEDIEGVTRVRLLEVVRVIPGEVPRIDIQKSSDLYRAHGTDGRKPCSAGVSPRRSSASFSRNSSRERSVHIRLDSARYDRDSDAERVKSWLRQRGFFDIERETDVIDENDPLWQALDALGGAAPQRDWALALGDQWALAGAFLRPTGRVAEELICPKSSENGCSRRIVKLSDGRFRAECGDLPRRCDHLALKSDEIKVLAVDVAKLGKAIIRAFDCRMHPRTSASSPCIGSVEMKSEPGWGFPFSLDYPNGASR